MDRFLQKNSGSVFLIVTACLLLVLSFGLRSGFGLFVKPISEVNEWGREVISFSLAIQNLLWGIVAVFAGGLADRFGNEKVIIAGAALYALGIYLMAGADSPWMLHTSLGLLVGSGIAGTSFGIVLPAMARAVGEERRQWALGLGTAAGSVGQFAMVPLAQSLITSYGWNSALYIMSASCLLMALLAIPLAPYSGRQESQQASMDQTIAQALREALRHSSYVFLLLGFFVCGFHVAFITAHMPAFLSDAGFEPWVGAWSISIIGLCNIFGAYLAGVISGSLPKRSVLVFIYFARAIAITAFLLIPFSLVSVLVFSAVMGFLWLATVPPTSGLVAVMFGTRYMALLYGVVFLSHQLGSFSGVWLGGWLYDNTGSYNGIWWAGIALGIVAAVLHLPIREAPTGRLAVEGATR